jgi:pyrroloquinoline-quinone synthase
VAERPFDELLCGVIVTTQDFLSAIDTRIAQYDLLCHPYYKAWTAGELTRDDLREYATAYYHHVAAFPTYLSALHTRMEDGPVRRSVLRNLCEEEIEGRPHSEMWLDFAEGMGADRDAVRRGAAMPEIQSVIDEFRRVARNGSTGEALAAFYAYESQIPRIAKEKATGLTERYGADNRTAGYFKLHQTADVRHSEVWRELLSREVQAHPEQAEVGLAQAEHIARSLWHVLDAMEARRLTVA